MDRFVGRQSELDSLREIADRAGAQFLLVCGRRRVGKKPLLLKWDVSVHPDQAARSLLSRVAQERGLPRPLTVGCPCDADLSPHRHRGRGRHGGRGHRAGDRGGLDPF